jgi:hypothetical protein
MPYSALVTSQTYSLLEANGEFIGMLLFAVIAVEILFVFLCMVYVNNTIQNEFEGKRWDLLVISNIYPQGIVSAKFAIAQINSWRTLTILISMRTAVIALLFLHMALLVLYKEITIESLYLIPFAHLLFIPFIIEPLWRVRALLAIAIAFRARIQNLIPATLKYIFVISSFEIVRIILIVFIALEWLNMIESRDIEGVALTLLCSPPLTISFGLTFFFVYRLFRIWGLRKAVQN